MKKAMKFFGILLVATVLVASCSDDNDPTDDNIFVGTYNGEVGYSEADGGEETVASDGSVTLAKVGDTYNFRFSNGIPNLTGIEIDEGQNTFVGLNGAITIDEGQLIINYTEDGATWTADCVRN
ncbi:MAG: hypothetical protein WA913_15925 [Pricia sp.]